MEKNTAKIEKILLDIVKDTKKVLISRVQALKAAAETKEEKAIIQKCIDALKNEEAEEAE